MLNLTKIETRFSENQTAPIQLQNLNRSLTSTNNSLGLSSSRLDLGSAESDIVKRNLITDFWSATSLPVNVPLHRFNFC